MTITIRKANKADADNPQAEALYARLGFKHIGEKDSFGHAMKHMVINID